MNSRGELADKVTGNGEVEKLKVNAPEAEVPGITSQTFPTAHVELMLVSEALKIVSCGFAKVRLRLL